MENAFGKYLCSPLFTFVVGADKQEVTVHSLALSELSESLKALMNGNMTEAKTRHVDWSEVDVDTFARLCEFAYLRDYTPPSPHVTDDRFLDSKSKAKKGKKDRKKKKFGFHRDESEVEAAPPAEPEMEPAPDEYRDPEPQPERVSDDDKELPYRERSIWTEHLRDAFVEGLAVPLPQQDGLVYDFSPPQNNLPWHDFTPVFSDKLNYMF